VFANWLGAPGSPGQDTYQTRTMREFFPAVVLLALKICSSNDELGS
jgi:hypothetical protein